MLRCTTPTNIIKINLAPTVIKSLTVLYAQNKCVLLEKAVAPADIFPSETSNKVCFARVDLTQADTAAFANVSSGRIEIQLAVQTKDNAVLYSHVIPAEVGRVLKDLRYDDAIAGTGQLDIDYDEVAPIAEGDFPPLTAIFDGEFDEVHYVAHGYEGLSNEDIDVTVDDDNWSISAQLSESRRAELAKLHETSATRIDFTVDPKTYVMTINLYNDKGELIDSDKQDIPLELALVGIKWDEANRSVIFKTDAGTETPVELSGIAMLTDLQETSNAVTEAFEKALAEEQQAREKSEQSIRDDLGQAIRDETEARTKAVEDLQQALNDGLEEANKALAQEIDDRQKAIQAEQKRAAAAEEKNADAIQTETDRAQKAEQSLGQQVQDETQRAKGEEAAIREELQNATEASGESLKQLEQSLTEKISTETKERKEAITAEENARDAAIKVETDRATEAERQLTNSLDTARSTLGNAITAEENRATTAEEANAAAIEKETARAQGVETTLGGEIDAIQDLIPTQASDANQLADKDFVNSTVQTQTAVFRGNFATKAALDAWQYENSTTATNNDYAVVQNDETHNNECWRYKYSQPDAGMEGAWEEEYRINEKPLTAAQAKALDSGVTAEKLAAMDKATSDEVARAKAAEQVNSKAIETETNRAQAAEQANAKAVETEATRAQGVETALGGRVDTEIADRKAAITQEVTDRDAAIKVETDRAKAEEAKKVNSAGGELKDTVVTFSDSEVTTDDNVKSGEKSSVLWAKVKRWFGRLKKLAFKDTVGTADIDNKAVTAEKLGDNVQAALQQVLEYDSREAFPQTGASGKIYIAKDDNIQYRWNGETYSELSTPLGETEKTAYAGNKGKANADAIKKLQTDITKLPASQVILDKDITLAGSYDEVGNIAKSKDGSTYSAKGKTVAQLIEEIFTKRLQPTKTNPTLTGLTLTGAGQVEVGTHLDSVSLSKPTFNNGRYTYDADTGVTVTSYKVIRILDGSEAQVGTYNSVQAVTDNNDGSGFTIGGTTNLKYRAEVTYSAGNVANDNLGTPSSPTVQIAAGTAKSNDTAAYTAYYPFFYGAMAATPTATTITQLNKQRNATGTVSVTYKEGDYVWFCTTGSQPKVTSSGFNVPLTQVGTAVYQGGTYKLFRTEQLQAGTQTFVIA